MATYAVLAFGLTWAVLTQLRDVESYADTELLRREGQLRGSLALTGQMRTTLRSLTAIDASAALAVAVAVDALDRVTLDLDADEIATVAYILPDLDTCVARVARAGHLPPLLVTPTGR